MTITGSYHNLQEIYKDFQCIGFHLEHHIFPCFLVLLYLIDDIDITFAKHSDSISGMTRLMNGPLSHLLISFKETSFTRNKILLERYHCVTSRYATIMHCRNLISISFIATNFSLDIINFLFYFSA